MLSMAIVDIFDTNALSVGLLEWSASCIFWAIKQDTDMSVGAVLIKMMMSTKKGIFLLINFYV